MLTASINWVGSQGYLVFPLLLSLWMAAGDLKARRIPNYLTLGTALAGLLYQGWAHGLVGVADGVVGLIIGLALLIVPYLMGGMGAGDVKALAALGAWLGPKLTMYLFVYMALVGGLMALAALWWRGLLWQKLRQAAVFCLNFILCRHGGVDPHPPEISKTPGLPYGLALALGMVIIYFRGLN
ncbi:MAG: prepilin peptidase [Deltaproteobacteria bacterium]|nr:prepilin peptidase [Deltaproteobacteria bacterium]